MKKNYAINGFGRIGRLTFRKLFEDKSIEVVAINDLTDAATLAYLLEYDSAQGRWMENKIKAGPDFIEVDGTKIKILALRDANLYPWKELNIDIVVESTGLFTSVEKAKIHLEKGAKKVAISAPAKGEGIKTIVYNVNHHTLDKNDKIISGASCTTNCLAPVAKVLNDNFKLVKGFMTTVHAVTNDQRLLDLSHDDFRRGRAAAWNIVPSKTGAASAIGLVLPEINGKLDGAALRVPVITGSIVDLVCEVEKNVTKKEINEVMKKHANETLGYNEAQIVSSDIIGSTHGSIFDATLTNVMTVDNKQLIKVVAWYDNESSYVNQFVRTLKHFANL